MKEKINIDEEGIFQSSEDVGFKFLLSRQVDRIGFLSTVIDTNNTQSVSNFGVTIRALEMMLISKWDKDYTKSEEVLKDKETEDEILEGWFEVLGNLMKLMDRQNLSFAKETSEDI